MRVVGKEGTLNAGVVFDIQDVPEDMAGAENIGGHYDNYDELDPEDDPGKTEFQVANAAVRGDYTFNPAVDPVEAEKLEGIEDPLAVVHAGPEADAGSSPAPSQARGRGRGQAQKSEDKPAE